MSFRQCPSKPKLTKNSRKESVLRSGGTGASWGPIKDLDFYVNKNIK